MRYPVLRVTFDDGLSGEYDLSDMIAKGPAFARLKDAAYFNTVAVGEHGHTFGWNLDDLGNEIDFCPDATRTLIETQKVEELGGALPAEPFRCRVIGGVVRFKSVASSAAARRSRSWCGQRKGWRSRRGWCWICESRISFELRHAGDEPG